MSMWEVLLKIVRSAMNTLFPKEPIVLEIEEHMRKGSLNLLPAAPELPKDWMYALFHYKHRLVRTLVWQIKFKGNRLFIQAVAERLSEEILSYFEEHGSFSGKEWLLVPIPASAIHSKEKGFNQTELIGTETMKTEVKNFVQYAPNVLVKHKNTLPQVAIRNRSERMRNLIGAYSVARPEAILGKNIILIDDVVTTGSTLIEAKRALKEAGAQKVVAFAVAH
jgi:ComF family protein